MAADGNCNVAVAKRIQHRKKAFTGHAEDMLDAVDQKLLHKRCGGGSARCVLMHRRFFQLWSSDSLTPWRDVKVRTTQIQCGSGRRGARSRASEYPRSHRCRCRKFGDTESVEWPLSFTNQPESSVATHNRLL